MRRLALFWLLAAWGLSACGVSLAGDVTPGPNALVSGLDMPQPVQHPAAQPDPAAGAAIYAQSCLACHGALGLGDGEQGAQLPFPPGAIGAAVTARGASPEDWFQMVNEGRITRYMPPFANSLSAQERWNVLAYVYSLSLTPEVLQRGAGLYAQYRSEVDILLAGDDFSAKTSLFTPLGLGLEDARALTAFVQARALGLDGRPVQALPQPTLSVAADETLGRVTGQLEYGSPGALPTGMPAILTGFDHTQEAISLTTQVDADGSFVFEDVPMRAGRIFFVEVGYRGLRYFSEFATLAAEQAHLDLPVRVFDTTQNTSQLVVEGVQLVYDFSQAGLARVIQRVVLTNLGDKAIAPGDDGLPLLNYRLPDGATNLAFNEGALGERYVLTADGFGDLRAVMPGQATYELLLAYQLPYQNSLTYQIYIDQPTRALVALAPETGPEMRSVDFNMVGTQDLEGERYAVYSATGPFSVGDEITIDLRGGHPAGGLSRVFNLILEDDSLLPGLFGLTLAVAVLWLWLRVSPAKPETLLDEIAVLDERYAAGQIAEAAYQRRRAALKARLAQALDRNRS